MSTTSFNNQVSGIISPMGFFSVFWKVNHASFPINQGDLVFIGSNIAKPVTGDSDCATLAGVALQPSAVSSSIDNSSAPAEKGIQVGFGLIQNFKTTASDTYADGDKVYVGADAQTVTSTAGLLTNYVGVVKLSSSQSTITGAAGVIVPILVFARVPVVFKQ